MTAVTEHEFTEMLMEHAKVNKIAGESDAAAFARIFSAPESIDIRRAHVICKSTPTNVVDLKPAQVSHNDAVDGEDSAAAYEKLQKMAIELQRSSPGLSEAQAFSKVFTDPANAALSEKAHRRPSATTNYAFPR